MTDEAAKAEGWQACVDWFAYNGQVSQSGYHVAGGLLAQAEEANPFVMGDPTPEWQTENTNAAKEE